MRSAPVVISLHDWVKGLTDEDRCDILGIKDIESLQSLLHQEAEECDCCEGTGCINIEHEWESHRHTYEVECHVCDGSGAVVDSGESQIDNQLEKYYKRKKGYELKRYAEVLKNGHI